MCDSDAERQCKYKKHRTNLPDYNLGKKKFPGWRYTAFVHDPHPSDRRMISAAPQGGFCRETARPAPEQPNANSSQLRPLKAQIAL